MDELLQRVRERLALEEPVQKRTEGAQAGPPREHYAELLEAMVLLVRDAEQLRSRVTPRELRTLSEEEREELLMILGKLSRELWACKSALERE
jgi:hypothetical protein